MSIIIPLEQLILVVEVQAIQEAVHIPSTFTMIVMALIGVGVTTGNTVLDVCVTLSGRRSV